MKTYYFRVLLLSLAMMSYFITFHSCLEDEIIPIEQETLEQKIKVKTISTKEFKQKARRLEIKDPMLNAYLKGEKFQLKNSNSFVKGVDDSKIIEIEDETSTTYTMRAITTDENSNTIYNIKEVEGEIYEYYTKYSMEGDNELEIINPITSEPIAVVNATCLETFSIIIETMCTCSEHQEYHSDGTCTHPDTHIIPVTVVSDCYGGPSGSPPTGGYPGPGYTYPGSVIGVGGAISSNISDSQLFILTQQFNLTWQEQIFLQSNLSPEELQEVANITQEIGPSTDVQNLVRSFLDGTRTKEEFLEELTVEYVLDPSFKENDCLMAVWNNAGSVSKFNEYLEPFENGKVSNLRFSAADTLTYQHFANNTGVNASTLPPISDNWIEIKYNTDNLDKPEVVVFKTLIHEMIHATILRYMLISASEIGQSNLNYQNWTSDEWRNYLLELKDDFPGIFDFYFRYKWNVPVNQNFNDAQHEQMASFYLEILTNALLEYNEGLSVVQAEAIAWQGLNNTSSWSIKSQEEKDAINIVYNNYLSNNPNCQ